MKQILNGLLTNWHFVRIFRLALGIIIAVQAISAGEIFSGLVAAFFLYQAVTDTGCSGSQGCSTSIPRKNTNNIEDVEFVEVKPDK